MGRKQHTIFEMWMQLYIGKTVFWFVLYFFLYDHRFKDSSLQAICHLSLKENFRRVLSRVHF